MTWLILDAVVAAIILFVVILSAKRGFVRTLIETVGFIAALIIAINLGNYLGGMIYEKAIEPKMVSAFTDYSMDSADNAVEQIWEKLPGFLKSEGEGFGISKEQISGSIAEDTTNELASAVYNMSRTVIYPLAVKFLGGLIAIILFILLLFLVKALAKLLNKLFSFSIIGKLNTTLGGALGLIKGCAIMAVVCALISLLVSLTEKGFLIFTPENISATYLFEALSKIIL